MRQSYIFDGVGFADGQLVVTTIPFCGEHPGRLRFSIGDHSVSLSEDEAIELGRILPRRVVYAPFDPQKCYDRLEPFAPEEAPKEETTAGPEGEP